MVYMVCNRNFMIDRSMTSKSWNNRSYDVKIMEQQIYDVNIME
jgi:hypothetical protein